MLVEKDNLVIRSAHENDAEVLTSWWNDGDVMEHAGYPKGLGISVNEVLSQIKMNQTHLSQRCVIEVQGCRIGECNFRLSENYAEIGIKICETAYQNKGLGSKILKMLIEYLFSDKVINESMMIKKIILDTNAKNLRAQHVYEKLGFKKTRTNIDAWKDQLGELQSSVDYELTFECYQKQMNS